MPVHPRPLTLILAPCVAFTLCGVRPASAADVELLPDMSVRMEIARYLANDGLARAAASDAPGSGEGGTMGGTGAAGATEADAGTRRTGG